MSETTSNQNDLAENFAVNLQSKPLEPDAYAYLKRTGLLRHVRWEWVVTLAKSVDRQVTLEEVSTVLATTGGRVTCSACGDEFEEPNVLVVRRDPDLAAEAIPGLPGLMSAHIARTKSGNLRFQGASFIIAGPDGKEEVHSFCGPLYFILKGSDGTFSQIRDNRSCLGIAAREARAAAEESQSPEDKAAGKKVFAPLPLTSDHADNILRAKAAAANRSAKRHENAMARTEEKRQGVKAIFGR